MFSGAKAVSGSVEASAPSRAKTLAPETSAPRDKVAARRVYPGEEGRAGLGPDEKGCLVNP